MSRCLIFLASLFFAFVAISSAASASPSEWKQMGLRAPSIDIPAAADADRGGSMASWATVPAPRTFAFVSISL